MITIGINRWQSLQWQGYDKEPQPTGSHRYPFHGRCRCARLKRSSRITVGSWRRSWKSCDASKKRRRATASCGELWRVVAKCGEMWRMRWVAVMLESHRDFGRCWGNDSATSMCSYRLIEQRNASTTFCAVLVPGEYLCLAVRRWCHGRSHHEGALMPSQVMVHICTCNMAQHGSWQVLNTRNVTGIKPTQRRRRMWSCWKKISPRPFHASILKRWEEWLTWIKSICSANQQIWVEDTER